MNRASLLRANILTNYTARLEYIGGRQYLIAPVTILVEGVHSGSAGPVFYPADELRNFPGAWNGRPLTLGHPQINGDFVSAGSPGVLNSFGLGYLYGVHFDATTNRLRGEAWVDVTLANRVAPEVVEILRNSRDLEVSTGLWFDESGGAGIWNNEAYETTARNFRPDHLALLPDSVGACSIEDGCGLRANHKEGIMVSNKGDKIKPLESEVQVQEEQHMEVEVQNEGGDKTEGVVMKVLRNLISATSPKVNEKLESLIANKPGMVTIIRTLQRMLDGMDRDAPSGRGMLVHYLEEAFDDGTFIMKRNSPEGTAFFRGQFTIDATTDAIEMGDSFDEVRMQREFIDVTNKETIQEDVIVPNVNEKVVVLVDALIACNECHYNESHREVLMGMEEQTLIALGATPVPEGSQEVVVENTAGGVSNEGEPTMDSFLATMPSGIRSNFADMLAANEGKREEMTKNILAVKENVFTENELKDKSISELTAVHSLVKPAVVAAGGSYAGALAANVSPGTVVENSELEDDGKPLGRPGLNSFATPKKKGGE